METWHFKLSKSLQRHTSTSSFKGTRMGSTPIDISLSMPTSNTQRTLEKRGRRTLRVREPGHLRAACQITKQRVIQIGLWITEEQVSRTLIHMEMLFVKMGGGQGVILPSDVKALATKPNDLCLIPWIHMVGENSQVIPWPLYACVGLHTQKYNFLNDKVLGSQRPFT